MSSLHIRRTVAAILTLSLLIAGSLSNIQTKAAAEKVLVVGQAELTDSLDPGRAFSTTAFIVHKATYQTLVTFPKDSTATIEPLLAKSWTVSTDGTVYTFTLQSGVKFSNGDTLKASDVVFSFTRLQNLKGNAAFLADTIKSVTAPDDQTVVLTLTQPDPTILSRLVNTAFSVLSAKDVQANGGNASADAAKTDKAETWLNSNSAGSGPYILTKWEHQVETDLIRNPNYTGPAPYFDRIVIKNLSNAATQLDSLKTGDVDLALDLTPDQISSVSSNSALKLYQGPTSNLHFLIFNEDKSISGPLADPKVQLAVRYALDYPGYLKLWGGTTPASILPVGFVGAYGTDKAFKQDTAKAKDLLSQAGYASGFDTTLTYPDWTFAGVNWGTNAQKIQSDLAAVGIKVKLDPQEINVALQSYRNGKEAFGYWFWSTDYFDPGDYLVFLPDLSLGKRVNWTAANADPAIVKLRDQALTETNPDKRVQIFAAIQDYLQQSGPWAPFLQNGVQVGYQANIQGVVYHPQWILDVTQLSRAG